RVPKAGMAGVKNNVRRRVDAGKPEDARKFKEEFIELYEGDSKLKKVIEKLEEGFDDAIQFLNEPVNYHKFIRSTHALERLNQEIRRREKVILIFPNTQSAYRLIGAVLMDLAEEQKKKSVIIGKE